MNCNTLKSVYIETICAFEKENYFGKDISVLGTATGFYYKYKNKMFLVTNKHVVTGKKHLMDSIFQQWELSRQHCVLL